MCDNADVAEPNEESCSMDGWETCPAVERDPLKVSGAWVFRGTRVPVYTLFENLKDGATIDQFLEWFPGVDKEQLQSVLEYETRSLKRSVGL